MGSSCLVSIVQPLFNVFVFATGRNKRQLTKVRASQTTVLTNGGAVNWAVVFSPFRTLSSRCCYIGLLLIALAFSTKLYIASESAILGSFLWHVFLSPWETSASGEADDKQEWKIKMATYFRSFLNGLKRMRGTTVPLQLREVFCDKRISSNTNNAYVTKKSTLFECQCI